MEEIEKIRKDIAEFVEKILSLVPPYDRISIFLRECGFSRNFREMSKAHPELLQPEVFSILQQLLGIEIGGDGSISFSYDHIGYYLNGLIANIYKVFDSDNFRKELSEFIGKDIPNPLEEYVKVCINAIKQQDTKMIEILKVLIDESHNFEGLKNELNKRGILLEEDNLKSYLRTLKRLGLVEESYGYRIKDTIKKIHLKNFLDE